MPNQHAVYAVAYDLKGNFLICRKLERGFFFGDGKKGVVYPKGKSLEKKGGGLYSLPGGGWDGQGDPAIKAADEFHEETGVQLRDIETVAAPWEYWGGVATGKKQPPNMIYTGVYFQMSPGDLNRVFLAATDNLGIAADVVVKIRAKEIDDYAQIRLNYPKCPFDNEQATAYLLNLEEDWDDVIRGLLLNPKTDWFYYILNNLRLALRSGLLRGGGK